MDPGGAGGLAIRQRPSTPLCHLEALSWPYPKDVVACASATFSSPKHKLMNQISHVTLSLCSFSVYLLKRQRAHVRGERHLGAASHICFHLRFISKRTHSQKHTVNPLLQKETLERLMGEWQGNCLVPNFPISSILTAQRKDNLAYRPRSDPSFPLSFYPGLSTVKTELPKNSLYPQSLNSSTFTSVSIYLKTLLCFPFS